MEFEPGAVSVREVIKGVFYRTAAALGLLLLSPVLLLVSLAILLDDGWPILFRQTRLGRNGRTFRLVKFRSMKFNRAGARVTSAADTRFTRVGRVLRKYKLDELPQLWNVLRGDMSLVGPRPEVPEFVDLTVPAWRTILSVKPGITDLATLLYRDEERLLAGTTEPEQYYREVVLPSKLALSSHFIETGSFGGEVRLICWSVYYSMFPRRFDADRMRRIFLGSRSVCG